MWQVIGQKRVISLLERCVERRSVAHGYLIVGPAHIGKMTLALNLAQALNCRSTEPPCGECAECVRIAEGKHPDIQVLSLEQTGETEEKARSEISIEQIRDVQRSAALPPFEGTCRVYIIDGAEHLSNEASNCLLKTLEEPSDYVYFILLTTNDRFILPTVQSRCQRLDLFPLSAEEIRDTLKQGNQADPEQAELLARLSHGCPGWAIQAVASPDALSVRNERLAEVIELMGASIEHRFDYAARLAGKFGKNRSLVYETLDTWLDWWRDLLLVKCGCEHDITNIDYEHLLQQIARRCSLESVRQAIAAVQSAGEHLKQNINPQLGLETMMFSIPVIEMTVNAG